MLTAVLINWDVLIITQSSAAAESHKKTINGFLAKDFKKTARQATLFPQGVKFDLLVKMTFHISTEPRLNTDGNKIIHFILF